MNEWSKEEDGMLLGMRKRGHTFAVISEEVGRSRCACIGRHHRLTKTPPPKVVKLNTDRTPRPRDWTTAEDGELHEHRTRGLTCGQIRIKMPHRSYDSITARLRVLRLRGWFDMDMAGD